jgi:hypothetical protein
VDPYLLRGALRLDDGGKEGPHGGAGRWLHPPVEAGARAAVHPRHPCVFEQGVTAPVVLPPERRRKAPVIFSTSGDHRRQQLALGGHARETGEAQASSGGLAEVTRWGSYRRGGRRRYPSPEGASFGGAAIAAFRDEAGGRFGGLADVLGFPPHRRPPQASSGYGREAGCRRPYPARDAPRPRVRFSAKCPILLLFCTESPLILTVGAFVHPQGLRFYKPSSPPVPKDAVDRAARRTAAEKKKEKKDAEKARARERMRARTALEKRRRRQERDGLPREPSPETPDDDDDDDDDDEGDDMAARLGLSPDLRLGQGSPSQPSGLAASTSGAGTSRSRSKERRQAGGVLDPFAEVIEVTQGSQVDSLAPQEQAPAPAVQEVDLRAVVTTPGQADPSAPRAPEAGTAPKLAAGQSSAAPAGTEARGASPQTRLALVRSG